VRFRDRSRSFDFFCTAFLLVMGFIIVFDTNALLFVDDSIEGVMFYILTLIFICESHPKSHLFRASEACPIKDTASPVCRVVMAKTFLKPTVFLT
jgi:hypothetical protein